MGDIIIQADATPEEIIGQLRVLIDDGEPTLTVMSNVASLLYWSLDAVNWVGFYLRDGDVLRLGPFHGKPACSVIPFGQGVCGIAAVTGNRMNVPDVLSFEGHIACDSASRSEMVLPLMLNDSLWGVLDIDSPVPNRFSRAEEQLLCSFVELFEAHLVRCNGALFSS